MKLFLFVAYTLFLLCVTIFSYLYIDANLIYLKYLYSGFSTMSRVATSMIYIIIVLVFFLFYSLFVWLAYKKRLSFRNIQFLIGMTVCILIFSYPAMLSYDIFNYMLTAKVLYFYRENPYIIMPIEFIGEPNLSFTHAANKVALYGPSWIALTVIPHLLGFGNFLLTLLSFKILIVLFYIATIILIWKTSRDNLGLVFFALNPLVIIETLVHGHNDIVMMCLAVFSFYLLMRKRILFAAIVLVLSILIKYATLFLIPVFAYAAIKTLRKQKIDWQYIFLLSFFSMLLALLLSPLREEMYPWYAIWFLTFASFVVRKQLVFYLSIAFSFGLLLRYVPFMLIGTHFGATPFFKVVLTFSPLCFVLMYLIAKKLWSKISFQ